MELTTDRLIIRSFRSEDVADYAALVADPEVMRYLGAPLGTDPAQAYVADCIERDISTGISRYAVVREADAAFLGFCGFKALTEDHGNQISPGRPWVDFGWRYRQSAWRQGYGIEAARATYDYGKQLGLVNVEARAHRDNIGSLRIIELLGFNWSNNYETPIGWFRRYLEPV